MENKVEEEKLDLQGIVNTYKINDIDSFILYLKDIWDLSQRSDQQKGVNKITLSSYYKLPGIFSERLFNVLDKNDSGNINQMEFVSGFLKLFTDDYEKNSSFIFKFYDFDKDGFISKADIRTVLSYIELNEENNNYKDRVKSQDELFNIIEKCFSNVKGEYIDYKEFKNVIENISSDIYLMILLFLYEKRPFTKTTLLNYSKSKSPTLSPKRDLNKNLEGKKVALPTYLTTFSPYAKFDRAKKRRRTTIVGDAKEINKKLLHIKEAANKETGTPTSQFKRSQKKRNTLVYSQPIIKLIPIVNEEVENNKSKNLDEFDINNKPKINRKKKMNLKDLGIVNKNDTTNNNNNNNNKNIKSPNFSSLASDIKFQPAFKQKDKKEEKKLASANKGKNESESNSNISKGKDERDKPSVFEFDSDNENKVEEEEEENEEEEDIIKFEGYLYKFIDFKMKKLWFKLIDKDLYYFKKENEEIHKGMHNLSGLFLNEEEPKVLDKTYYCFSIAYTNKTRYYYCDNQQDYKLWLEKLKIATGYTNLTDIYDIKNELGKGKFGLIKLGVNKKTNDLVAIKILSKKEMTNKDLELVRTEIEILKICQHPNIIRLYEIFENINYIYIIMEYCPGGDLFTFLEKRNFKLKEPIACKIIHKLCAAVYYLHSYGIAHRDLKPENVLMTSNDDNADIKLLDFGLSKIIGPEEKCNEPFGTLSYVAPEVLLERPYGKEVDEWSIGIMTYLMLSASLPFDDKDEYQIAKKTAFNEPTYNGYRWFNISKEAIDFIKKLLIKEPSKRMNIKEALKHDWLKKFGGAEIIDKRKEKNEKNEFKLFSAIDGANEDNK